MDYKSGSNSSALMPSNLVVFQWSDSAKLVGAIAGTVRFIIACCTRHGTVRHWCIDMQGSMLISIVYSKKLGACNG